MSVEANLSGLCVIPLQITKRDKACKAFSLGFSVILGGRGG